MSSEGHFKAHVTILAKMGTEIHVNWQGCCLARPVRSSSANTFFVTSASHAARHEARRAASISVDQARNGDMSLAGVRTVCEWKARTDQE